MHSQRHIFIGGTGRSGTTILGTLFHLHPDVLFFGEPRFLGDEGGLCDFIRGKISAAQFEDAMINTFRERMVGKLVLRGFADAGEVYSVERLRELVRSTLTHAPERHQAARLFVDRLFGLGLQARAKKHWAEKTPSTMLIVDELYRLYPDMRYIHIIREPKSICFSMLQKLWGPKSVAEFVDLYVDSMRRAFALQAAVPSAQYHVMSLEGLVRDKAGETARVFRFAGLPADEAFLAACGARIRDDGDHGDRWKQTFTADDARTIDAACGPIYHQWQKREADSHHPA